MWRFSDVIDLWPSVAALAADLSLPYGVVKQWRLRDSIPSSQWLCLVKAAERRSFDDVSLDRLAVIALSRGSKKKADDSLAEAT